MFDQIPNELKAQPNWCLYRLIKTPNRITKCPFQPNGNMVMVNNRRTWNIYNVCVKALVGGKFDGLGFVFSDDIPICGIDLDHVVDEQGNIAEWATDILEGLRSYTEYSPSKKGLHVLVRTYRTKINRRIQVNGQGLEVYRTGRYFTVTGDRLEGYPTTIETRDEALEHLAHKYGLLTDTITTTRQATSRSLPCPLVEELKPEDNRVVELAKQWYSSRLERLLQGDLSDVGNDPSRGDLSLCSMLARTTNNPIQIERIWLNTTGRRDKVRLRADYRQRTILKAISSTSNRTTSYSSR